MLVEPHKKKLSLFFLFSFFVFVSHIISSHVFNIFAHNCPSKNRANFGLKLGIIFGNLYLNDGKHQIKKSQASYQAAAPESKTRRSQVRLDQDLNALVTLAKS